MPRLTKARRAEIEQLLADARAAQDLFWDALHDLEAEIGYCDGIADEDFQNHDVDSILGFAKDHAENS